MAISVGSGLGLSQVFGFVRSAGGHVAIASVIGVGTTVSMYLPRSHAAPGLVASPVQATLSHYDPPRTGNASWRLRTTPTSSR